MVNGAAFGLVFGAAMAMAMAAAAQSSGDIGLGKRLYQDKATCGFCHGWSGDGAGDDGSELGFLFVAHRGDCGDGPQSKGKDPQQGSRDLGHHDLPSIF